MRISRSDRQRLAELKSLVALCFTVMNESDAREMCNLTVDLNEMRVRNKR